ncbi:hypothetical protein [Bacillus mesophilum]|uniref:ABM domain-containing protein n=1 Tax=Bacillus mesophilum TaxID=1071718 RepID=A0A7V7RJ72_9BACI|nr:hypothetical protein [Bacillus mesophilum]KAB2330684.1 hypothetical protein F7732_18745 [Bacillus mesophilum]
MFVKMYEYYIQDDKLEEFLVIQEKASKIYGRYLSFQTQYLQSKDDPTKWIEITRYNDEKEYIQSLELINQHPEIQALFKAFQSVLLTSKREIREGNYTIRKEISHTKGKGLMT